MINPMFGQDVLNELSRQDISNRAFQTNPYELLNSYLIEQNVKFFDSEMDLSYGTVIRLSGQDGLESEITHEIKRRSQNGDKSVHITFRNCCKFTCGLYWVDYDGNEVQYGSINADQIMELQTFNTHVWALKNEQQLITVFTASDLQEQNFDIYPTQQEQLVANLQQAKVDNGQKKDIVLFPSYGVRAEDCIQGQIGDCWLHQSISAAAHDHPDQIKSLFTPQVINPQGFYVVKLYSGNDKQYSYVLIDDQIPSNQNNPKYAQYTKKSGCEESGSWVILLEKAYAKLQGGYENLEASKTTESCHIVLQRLLGGEANWYEWHKNGVPFISADELWMRISDIKSQNKTISLSSAHHKSKQFIQHGIVDFHGYALFQIREVQSSKGQVKLIQVRNTWGKQEWDGEWSDNSPIWKKNPNLVHELQKQSIDEGIFWISLQDFHKEFSILWWN